MPDPLEELRNIRGDLSATPLPAAEVRRRGDRMRRRRRVAQSLVAATGLALVVTAGPVVVDALSEATPPPPVTTSPTPSPTSAPPSPGPSPEGGWVTEIPTDLPLGTGLPGPDAEWRLVEDRNAATGWAWLPCSRGAPTQLRADGDRTDHAMVEAVGPDENTWNQLVLYPDAATARRALRELGDITADCTGQEAVAGVTEVRWAPEQTTFAGHRGLQASAVQYLVASGEPAQAPGRTLLTAVRVGNAVLVAQHSDAASAGGFTDRTGRALLERTARLSQRMCVFGTEPCEAGTSR